MEQKQQNKESKTLFRRAYESTRKYMNGVLIGAALGVAVAGCGARSSLLEAPADSGMHDGSRSDVVMFDTRKADAGIDSQKPDSGLQKPDSYQQKPDSGVPPQYSYTVNNLIGDYLNRELLDRNKGLTGYPFTTSETRLIPDKA